MRVVGDAVHEFGSQRDFYDHAVRNDEALFEIARYIVANPLRAKLVDSVADYPHWYARWL